eukprot:CAMPEP_0170170290 /NCGR_PEP_ID=MMETSP0040_2-20121228/3265_1 /TAXON_ID=641309 /ORGANISM="Lotharella oceanica, Strain CCMP622" /LENGTH=236 /DNA_ID=CAMNT_0010409593 /DNA_START=189 /DNA_END=903 /DNA_ORIENTATION=-
MQGVVPSHPLGEALVRDMPGPVVTSVDAMGRGGLAAEGPRGCVEEAYILAEKEARRLDITVQELGRYLWRLTYNDEPEKTYFAKFKPRDIKNNLGCGVVSIPELEAKDLSFSLDLKVGQGGTNMAVLTVENFPPHYAARSNEWRWVFANSQVQLVSLHDSEAPEEAARHGAGSSKSWDVVNFLQQSVPAIDMELADDVDMVDLRQSYDCPELQKEMSLAKELMSSSGAAPPAPRRQ